MNPDIKNFYEFTVDDFALEGYEPGPQIKNIPVAV
jgi:thymidylate synthase